METDGVDWASPYASVRILNTTMLPVHRSSESPSEVGGRSFKWPSFVFSKPMVRWSVLACVVIAVIWFGDLLSLAGKSELLSRPWPWDSPITTTATTTNHLRLPSNSPRPPTKEEQDVWEPRKNEVRNAFKHAWSGYKSIAYPYDELLPVSGGRSNKFLPPPLLHFGPLTLFFKGIMAGV